MKLVRSLGALFALSALFAAVGCGGGGSSGKSASTAAGVTSQSHAPLPEARAGHTALRLKSGAVLIVGGFDASGNPLASTVIVTSAGVTRGPSLATPRAGHSAVLLASGEVLIAGGQSDDLGTQVLDSTEIFDPQAQTFLPGPSMSQARAHHVALSYFDGRNEHVLIAGGVAALNTQTQLAPALSSAEDYDLTQQSLTSLTATLSQAQSHAQVARLDTGGLLIVGGRDANGPAAAQVFTPATRDFAPLAAVAARSGAAVASRGREVLVAGGESALGIEDTSEVFDSLSGTFSPGVLLGAARFEASATVVNSEIVLVGGRDAAGAVARVERLKGASVGQSRVEQHLDLATARYAHSVTFVDNAQLLVVGGYDRTGTATAAIELIDLNASVPPAASATTPAPSGLALPTSTGTAGLGGSTAPAAPATPTATAPIAGSGSTSTTPSTGSGSSSGSSGSSLTSTLLQSAIQALTASQGSGGGFSGFLSTFAQTLLQNLLGGGATGGSGSGLSGILSSLLGGSSGSSSGGGLSGILSSLLGGGSGSATSGTSGSSGGGLSGLLSSLLGGGSSTATPGASGASSTALTIQSMTPGQGAVGSQVTITGINFGANVSVSFNGVPAGINSASLSAQNVVTVVCTVPAGATTGMVEVTSNGMTASAGLFTVQ